MSHTIHIVNKKNSNVFRLALDQSIEAFEIRKSDRMPLCLKVYCQHVGAVSGLHRMRRMDTSLTYHSSHNETLLTVGQSAQCKEKQSSVCDCTLTIARMRRTATYDWTGAQHCM